MLLGRPEIHINAADRYGRTSLTFAMDGGRLEMLLQHKDLNVKALKMVQSVSWDFVSAIIKP
jgi:hypothetical protein